MAATEGSNFLTSRSCLVPINRAMTLSISFATSMEFSLFPVTADRAGRNPAVEVRPNGNSLFYLFRCACAKQGTGETRAGFQKRVRGRSGWSAGLEDRALIQRDLMNEQSNRTAPMGVPKVTAKRAIAPNVSVQGPTI